MSDWLEFEGRVEPLEWGRATSTIRRLPDGIAAALTSQGSKPVEGEINDRPVNLALFRAPVVDGVFLWAGQSLLDRLKVGPGEPLEGRLRPAPGDEVDTSEDVALALRQTGAIETWEVLRPGKRRGRLYRIDTARMEPTRLKRITALVADLGGDPA